jgi:hypothetical protein
MSRQEPGQLRKPRVDDGRMWDILLGICGYQTVLVAHQVKLFPLLDERARTPGEIGSALGMALRPVQALLGVCAALGLVERNGNAYRLTPFSADYFLPASPTYFGDFIDLAFLADQALYAPETQKRAMLTNRSQVFGGDPVFGPSEEQAERMAAFTRAMHGHSMAAATAWPDLIDLAAHRVMLDVGGGSGAHALGAVHRWPALRAIVLDLPAPCRVASALADRYGLGERVTIHPADMWSDPFPPADLHFYGDIFHDWPDDKCRLLAGKSFQSLPSGGRIVLHEMLYDDAKTGPFAAAAYSVAMLLWTEGQQRSAAEFRALLGEAGFPDVRVQPSTGPWSLMSGRKP